MSRTIDFIIRWRKAVVLLTLIVTALAVWQAKNLRIVIDPNTMLPQSHPYISTGADVARIFGSKYIVVVSVTPLQGDIYQPNVLAKVRRMTDEFLAVPGVVKANVLSLTARRVKDIAGQEDGFVALPLVPPATADLAQAALQMQALRTALARNPVYADTLVSRDERTTALVVEFQEDAGGYSGIMAKVAPVVEGARDASVEIRVGGAPAFLARIEAYSERMAVLLPIAIVLLGLVLYGSFRSRQGLLLPLLTGILAVAWGLGAMGAAGIPMDVFNATTPILILAVATGHAVQMLKRYYEEYAQLRDQPGMAPREANRQAVAASLRRVGPVMIAACTVAALGFFSLVVFDVSTVRTFGIFTGVGILATGVLEITFIPALRAMLRPPTDRELRSLETRGWWSRVTEAIARWTTGPARQLVYVCMAAFVVLALVGTSRVVVDNSMKSYFSPGLDLLRDDEALNTRLGGTNTVFLLVEGKAPDAIKNPRTLAAMEALQRHVEQLPDVGKTVSIADFVKRMNQAMHGDDPAHFRIPASGDLISQYLLLYAMSGEPGDFDSVVDYGYQRANITVFLKSDSTANFEHVADSVRAWTAQHMGEDVQVRIGGGLAEGAALSEVMVHGKVLNIVQIAAVVGIVSSLLFRSLLAGALVLLPLVVAVLANFGLMGWAGIPLNISTALISAMAVGIGADYAIYLIYRLREEFDAGTEEREAVRRVVTRAGKAILFVAVAVSAGYGVLLLSFGFRIHQWMAVLIAAAMIVSALAALLLIPALILTFKPAFAYRRKLPCTTSPSNNSAAAL
jgi:uncharacterized protein